jgi:hypothetical protein
MEAKRKIFVPSSSNGRLSALTKKNKKEFFFFKKKKVVSQYKHYVQNIQSYFFPSSSNGRLSAVQSGSNMPTKNKGWHKFPNNKHMPLLLILIALFMDPIHLLLSQSHKNSSS